MKPLVLCLVAAALLPTQTYTAGCPQATAQAAGKTAVFAVGAGAVLAGALARAISPTAATDHAEPIRAAHNAANLALEMAEHQVKRSTEEAAARQGLNERVGALEAAGAQNQDRAILLDRCTNSIASLAAQLGALTGRVDGIATQVSALAIRVDALDHFIPDAASYVHLVPQRSPLSEDPLQPGTPAPAKREVATVDAHDAPAAAAAKPDSGESKRAPATKSDGQQKF